MANVAHSTLTGSDLHEPKGVTSAPLGTVYVSNGAGSGTWNDVGTASFTGMIADFVAPLPPAGWLELDGSVISTSTYNGLYAVMTMQSSGTRTNGSPIVTSIASTANFKAGYFVFGTGIGTGITIVSVDSANQVTLSGNASSSGTAAFAVSPWQMNTGTISLPNLTTAGRFRRSRTSTTKVGDTQASQNLAHTHTGSGTTSTTSANHTHTFAGTTGDDSPDHSHTTAVSGVLNGGPALIGSGGSFFLPSAQNYISGGANARHVHAYSGTTSGHSAEHTHTYSFTSASDGGSEARPLALVVLTCVKT